MLSAAYDTVDHTLSFLLVQDYIERFFTDLKCYRGTGTEREGKVKGFPAVDEYCIQRE